MLDQLLLIIVVGAGAVFGGGVVAARMLRENGLRWTWAMLGLPAGMVLWKLNPLVGLAVLGVATRGCIVGARWQREDLAHGADHVEAAHSRLGIADVLRRGTQDRQLRESGSWVHNGRLVVGRDERGMAVAIPVGYESGSHTLVLGATGAGKTVSEAWVACRLIEQGHGAVVIDPKGDRMLCQELQAAAERAGAEFLQWTPEGPLAYNPYARGSDTEIADKALAGERFTEPHYLRQAQRYLGHAVRAMRTSGVQVTLVSLMENMDPRTLEVTARKLPESEAEPVQNYLDSLGERQQRELSGVRDRLAILAESELRPWLEPNADRPTLDIHQAVEERAVVYVCLDADRRLLLSTMLAGAVVTDLVTLVGRMQHKPVPTVVMIDEFSAIAAEPVARLFGRARSAGISLILGTQELADLKGAEDSALREQVLGNVAALIAHRQNVPESAELIAAMAGTRPVWVTTQQTEEGLLAPGPSGKGSRRRGHEYEIHPSRIKRLGTGQAVVITPGSGRPPTVVHVNHPSESWPGRSV
jgi:conjugal transfer pilus assembly protein TraD